MRAAEQTDQPSAPPSASPSATDETHIHSMSDLPSSALAQRLVLSLTEDSRDCALALVDSEIAAEEIAQAFRVFAPEVEVLVLPPWDCLPYDRVAPSRESMGRRMAFLHRLTQKRTGIRLVVASLEAAIQRLPPAEAAVTLRLCIGETLDRDAFETFVLRAGYVMDDRVDEAGEVACLGDVIDIFPADAAKPVRLVLDDNSVISELRLYNALTQRTEDDLDEIVIGPATELIPFEEADAQADGQSMEALLLARYGSLPSLFSHLPDASVIVTEGMEERLAVLESVIIEARQAQRDFGKASALSNSSLYLTHAEFLETLAEHKVSTLEASGVDALPAFILSGNPLKAFSDFAVKQQEAQRRVIIAGDTKGRRRIVKRLERVTEQGVATISTLDEALVATLGTFAQADWNIESGFIDESRDLTVIAAADVFGAQNAETTTANVALLLAEPELRTGDVVIHEDYGVGILRALEQVEVDGVQRDTVRLEYHGGASILVPVEEFGCIWRYGAQEEAISLDRLNTDAWDKRRAAVSRDIDSAAAHLISMAQAREDMQVPPIVPSRARYARLAARFPYPETPDQAHAIQAVLDDLASGRTMNRLICGDVGFGKTEIALRAAAAVALSGRQVIMLAPTTVLVRQHFESFERRFIDSGITVKMLSRVVSTPEAKAVKEGLKSGEVHIVVATQAVMAKDVGFSDVALLIVDEEHRFGTKLKSQMANLAPGLHTLTMSATPIPRTLQSAMVGVQDVSILASPPARRRPVRTFLTEFDGAAMRIALMRERRRGGQSFIVVPQIADIAGLEDKLKKLVPELSVRVAHGEQDAKAMDETMVDFADGNGDILLSTNIIESGLDVPRANTMFVWRADRFGLAQLHQLRGRVGRGRAQGVTYLLTEPGETLADDTRSRLSTLVAFDRLGSGLAISGRDLDLRGAGDLVGEEQAGHMKVIGVSLYQRLLARAVSVARGETDDNAAAPQINLGLNGAFPVDYVPEATVRLNLYARLQRLTTNSEIDAFAEEIEDRFGEMPEEVVMLLDVMRVKLAAARTHVSRIDAGPVAIAIDFRRPLKQKQWTDLLRHEGLRNKDERLIYAKETETAPERLKLTRDLLATIRKTM